MGIQVKGVYAPLFKDLLLDFDAKYIPGASDGNPIAQWDERKHGINAIPPSEERRPIWDADDVNGVEPAVLFNGSHGLKCADNALYKVPAIQLYVVCNYTGDSDQRDLVLYPHSTSHTTPFFRWVFGARSSSGIYLRIELDAAQTDTGALTSSYAIYSYSTSDRKLYKNGGLFYSGTGREITYPNNVGLHIGMNASEGERYRGGVAKISICAGTHEDSVRQRIERRLSERYQITLTV